jgi:hypothetical protein
MSPAMPFDEATSRRVEAAYRTPGIAGQRRAVLAGDIASWASDLAGLGTGYFCSLDRYLFLAVRR